jgi:hypothetical protein
MISPGWRWPDLSLLIGFQSFINIGVNLELLPAKGMTLPLVSYGGSSMIAVAITAGFVLALTRRRPESRAQPRLSTGRQRAWRRSRAWTKGKLFLLSAGGTGGHLFPAQALAHELVARGHRVHLVTDSRAERFAGKFPASDIHVVRSATIGSKNPVKLMQSCGRCSSGVREAGALIRKIRPDAVIGFGGYPTIPPLLAASNAGLPTMLHEQNAVMGRANKALASRVKAIAGGFLPEGKGRACGQDGDHRQPGAAGSACGGGHSLCRRRWMASRSAWWCLAAARARSSSPMPFPRRSRCCPIRCGRGCELTQQARPEDEATGPRAAFPSLASRPRSRRSSPTWLPASGRRIW